MWVCGCVQRSSCPGPCAPPPQLAPSGTWTLLRCAPAWRAAASACASRSTASAPTTCSAAPPSATARCAKRRPPLVPAMRPAAALLAVPTCPPFCNARAQVYASVVRPLVDAAVLHGASSVVLAWGQTSSGKTHTMHGAPADPQGMVDLALHDLLERPDMPPVTVWMSCCQVRLPAALNLACSDCVLVGCLARVQPFHGQTQCSQRWARGQGSHSAAPGRPSCVQHLLPATPAPRRVTPLPHHTTHAHMHRSTWTRSPTSWAPRPPRPPVTARRRTRRRPASAAPPRPPQPPPTSPRPRAPQPPLPPPRRRRRCARRAPARRCGTCAGRPTRTSTRAAALRRRARCCRRPGSSGRWRRPSSTRPPRART